MVLRNLPCALLLAVFCVEGIPFIASEEDDPPYHGIHNAAARDACFEELQIDPNSTDTNNQLFGKLLTCLLIKDGVITPQGKFSLKKAEQLIKAFYSDDEMRDMFTEMAIECEKEINGGGIKADEELTDIIMDCFFRVESDDTNKGLTLNGAVNIQS